jgi:ubiquitin-protein ligase
MSASRTKADPSRADPNRVRMLQGHYRRATASYDPYIKYAMDEDDINVWYVKFHNLDAPFKGGEYIAKFIAPKNFPYDPPGFEFLTPNGVYSVGGGSRPCISIGEYHSNAYPAVLGMHQFPVMILGTLLDYKMIEGGIAVMKTTAVEKQQYADESLNYNSIPLEVIDQMIERQYAEYSKKFPALASIAEESATATATPAVATPTPPSST